MMPLKKYFFVLALLFSFSGLRSQFTGYTFCDWSEIKFDQDYIPKKTDTCIVFVSARRYFPDKKEYLDNDFDSTHTLHYFNIYFARNSWVCVPRKSIEEAFS